MANFNNFENLIHVAGRTFRDLQRKLVEIEVPVRIITMEVRQSGSAYAVLIADRPAKSVNKKSKPTKTIVVTDDVVQVAN